MSVGRTAALKLKLTLLLSLQASKIAFFPLSRASEVAITTSSSSTSSSAIRCICCGRPPQTGLLPRCQVNAVISLPVPCNSGNANEPVPKQAMPRLQYHRCRAKSQVKSGVSHLERHALGAAVLSCCLRPSSNSLLLPSECRELASSVLHGRAIVNASLCGSSDHTLDLLANRKGTHWSPAEQDTPQSQQAMPHTGF